jgi:hypothetical protein
MFDPRTFPHLLSRIKYSARILPIDLLEKQADGSVL